MNCGFTTTIPNSNVKVRHAYEEKCQNIRKFGNRNWRGRSKWWRFSTVGRRFINTSVLSRGELMVNITQQSSSNCYWTSKENVSSWSTVGSSIRITCLPIGVLCYRIPGRTQHKSYGACLPTVRTLPRGTSGSSLP